MDFFFSVIVATATEKIDRGAICDVLNPEVPTFLPLQLQHDNYFRFNCNIDKNVAFKLKYLLIQPPTQS